MAEPSRSSDARPGVPRWVKVFGVVAVGLVVAFVVLHLAGGGFAHHLPT